MAAEGEFPKVDGDVLYGSEVNIFNLQPRNWCSGVLPTATGWGGTPGSLSNVTNEDFSSFATTGSVISGTGYVWVDLGSDAIHSTIHYKYTYVCSGGASARASHGIFVSGANGLKPIFTANVTNNASGLHSSGITLPLDYCKFQYVGFRGTSLTPSEEAMITPYEMVVI